MDQIAQTHELAKIYTDFSATPKRIKVASICDPIERSESILELIIQNDTGNISKYAEWLCFLLIVCKIFQKKNLIEICYDDNNNKLIRGRIKEGRDKEIMMERRRQVFQKIYQKMTACLLKTDIFSVIILLLLYLINYLRCTIYVHTFFRSEVLFTQ